MKRIDKVYEYIKEQTKDLDGESLRENSGVTTNQLSEALGIQRSNASKDLNCLVREGLIDKMDGRPVRYVCKSVFRHKPFSKYVESYREVSAPVPKSRKKEEIKSKDIFKRVVGSYGSMKNSTEQAKAAILYPPRGLNSLIIGPTGSGKTFFAHTMFQFAKQNKVVGKDKEMIVFNCADYASNPELLMSHLFGHVKGAFTGAEQEKDGIISLANDSFLFLDEIHRLPPEGQEMVFYFMDTGTFAKLGETQKNNRANVRIICATTEDPASSLLNTFVRRIPITIQLPSFKDRTAREKIDLVKMMMTMEAKRIQRKIILSEDVVKALVGSVSYGNVGQLKSNVQLVSAQSFLNQMDREELHISLDELNEGIKEGLISLAHDRRAMAEITPLLSPQMVISPNEPLEMFAEDSYELPYNLYEIIGDKAAVLKEDGLSQDAINHFISTDINVHLKSFYRNHGFTFDTESKLTEIIDQRIINTTRKIYEYAREALNYDFQTNFLYAMGFHISSFLNRLQNKADSLTHDNENIKNMVAHYPEEMEVANVLKKIIEEDYQVEVPTSEVHYLTVLLVSLRENKEEGRIGVVVAAHGNSTATSMVQVVTQLLKVDNLRAVDMPLDMKPKEAYEKIVDEVVSVNEGSGVMLLVDMGSLGTFSDDIKQETGIEIKVIDMVTTAIVLEAARKSSLLDTSLDDLFESLSHFYGYTMQNVSNTTEITGTQYKEKAIVAICASGKGTAQRMKELIDRYLVSKLQTEIVVFPVSVVTLNKDIQKIRENYQIIATTGIKDPKIEVPFISMDHLFSDSGALILEEVLNNNYEPSTLELSEDEGQKMCYEYMQESFTFINPEKLVQPLWDFTDNICQIKQLEAEIPFYINLCMHTAGAIERELRDDRLTASQEELNNLGQSSLYQDILPAFNLIENLLQLKISEAERYFIIKIIENEIEKK
ncbi:MULTISPECIES: sigma-54-dependent transcriptional regulator [Vagococcus]|uniref:DNA translocase FtsK n=1 Tax=Vagococcus fluvialis bH819 TaxID=1255619 RepID=A0A1X6WJT9_9ENTE|nr:MULTISPECIES: sigma-54-dependent transcriptional regulator [Vagococcus]SLM84490.1 NtrC family Transcriptional regulator, ATPase domain [Vagococcus fluvialis bH819]HCM90528.1 sigma-54-dependent transcriptional regulator [Vagococcus sp.]